MTARRATRSRWASSRRSPSLFFFDHVRDDDASAFSPTRRSRTRSRQDFGDLTRNGPWLAIFSRSRSFVFITLSMRGGVMLYYFKYYVDREDLFSVFNVCGLAVDDRWSGRFDASSAAIRQA